MRHLESAAALTLVLALAAPSSSPCTHEGSRWVAPRFERGGALGCQRAPEAPAWRLLTPGHRETVPRHGHTFVRARQVPRLLLVYGCTESWLRPVTLQQVRTSGYVFDVTTAACR